MNINWKKVMVGGGFIVASLAAYKYAKGDVAKIGGAGLAGVGVGLLVKQVPIVSAMV